VVGSCWPWSSKTDSNGELVKDVKIGDFALPWETHDKITSIPKGYVRWYEWAYRSKACTFPDSLVHLLMSQHG